MNEYNIQSENQTLTPQCNVNLNVDFRVTPQLNIDFNNVHLNVIILKNPLLKEIRSRFRLSSNFIRKYTIQSPFIPSSDSFFPYYYYFSTVSVIAMGGARRVYRKKGLEVVFIVEPDNNEPTIA